MLLLRTLLAASALLGSPGAPRPVAGHPAQIVLFRHAEKPADPNDPHLSKAGKKRARKLVRFIGSDVAVNHFGPPVAIYATRTTKHEDGQRTQETVAPLAAAMKLRVQTPYLGKEYAALARDILANRAYDGKTVVICWNHEAMSELVAALGVSPPPAHWKGSVYDRVYIISWHDGEAIMTTEHYDSK